MKKNITILFALCLMVIQCTTKHIDELTLIHENSSVKTSYSSFFDEVEFVKLETNPNCFMSGIMKLDVDGDRIFTFDSYMGMIFIFTRKGKFVGKVGKKGGGPGEFISAKAYSLDRINKQVHVLDAAKRILIFDYNGNFLASHKAMWATGFEVLNDGSDLFYHYNTIFRDSDGKNIDGDVVIMNQQGIIKQNYNVRTVNRNLNLNTFTNLYKTREGEIYLVPIFDNSLFKIGTDNSLQKVTEFVFDNHPPHDLFVENDNSRTLMNELTSKHYPNRIQRLSVSEKYIYFVFIQDNESNQVFWNRKENGLTVILKQDWENDIVMFKHFLFQGSFENGMVQSIDSDKFLKSYSEGMETPSKFKITESTAEMKALYEIVNSTDTDDNPILIFYSYL